MNTKLCIHTKKTHGLKLVKQMVPAWIKTLSVLANKQCFPSSLIYVIASSTVAYETEHKSSGMKSFIEVPSEYDKWWISRNSLISSLSTIPIGEHWRLEKGVNERDLQFYLGEFLSVIFLKLYLRVAELIVFFCLKNVVLDLHSVS